MVLDTVRKIKERNCWLSAIVKLYCSMYVVNKVIKELALFLEGTSEMDSESLSEELDRIPIIDVHSHIDPERPQAKNIGDILFYHFLQREIVSAGGDDGFFSSQVPINEKVAYYLRYVPLIENTATYWCQRKILKDLYGFDFSDKNWEILNKKIAMAGDDPSWPEKLLVKNLNVKSCLCCTSDATERKRETFSKYSFLLPHLESFSFGPNYLESLMAFIGAEHGAYPENLDSALESFTELIVKNIRMGIRSFGSAIDENLDIMLSEDAEVRRIYRDYVSGKELSQRERNALSTRFLYQFLQTIEDRAVAQWYLGAAWKFGGRKGEFGYGESYVYVNHKLIPSILKVFKDFPKVKFNVMYCAEALSQQLTIIARMLPNVTLLAFWWHNLFPTYIEKLISERVEALPANKWILVATDAYNCEWSYGKLSLVKKCLAKVLARKIDEGYLTVDNAISLAWRVLYTNPCEIYKI